MAITASGGKLHWNYVLALDSDLEKLSRFVEFTEANLGVYSIELAHILFAAASEVDVIAKLLCKLVEPTAPRTNMDQYRRVLAHALPDVSSTRVFVPRYGLEFSPWEAWASDTNPAWWRSYNNVKHQRDAHFSEATLKNALNALGALLIVAIHFYSRTLAVPPATELSLKKTTYALRPESSLIRLSSNLYHEPIFV